MSDLKSINIAIPSPCHEPWDGMTPDAKANGRFCDSCQKTVIDFSSWNDTQLFAFFANGTQKHICGRFLTTQVNRPINIPHQPHSQLYRMTVALGLTLIFAQAPQLLAQTAPPQTTQTERKEQPDSNRTGSLIFVQSPHLPELTTQPRPTQMERKEINNIITGRVESETFRTIPTPNALRLYSDSMIRSFTPDGIGSMANEKKPPPKSHHKKKKQK